MSNWKGENNFYDPLCGSGTLAIEAAMIATNTPALFHRKHFGFMNWKSFDPELWQEVLNQADQNMIPLKNKIFASDMDKKQLEVAKMNIAQAGLSQDIILDHIDFFETKPQSESGTIVLNPPYGERLVEEEINHLYKRIGSHLKHEWPGHKAWIISSNVEALKFIGLKPSIKHTLMNGPLQCRYQQFEMFGGKHSEFKTKHISDRGTQPPLKALKGRHTPTQGAAL